MLGLSATYNYFLSYGSVDMLKGCFSLSQMVRDESFLIVTPVITKCLTIMWRYLGRLQM